MNTVRGFRAWFFSLLFFCLFESPFFAQEFSYSGSFSALSGIGLPNTHDNKGDFLTGALTFDNTVKAYFSQAMFCTNAVFIADGVGSQSTNGVSSFVSDDGHFAIKLKEAYVDYNGGVWAVRVGRQISAWGKADGIQVADVLCPQDESTIIASSYKESRQGIDALRLSFTGTSVQADVYWIPFFTPSTLPLAKNNPLRAIVFPSRFDGFSLVTPTRYDDLDLPEKKFTNSEWALRVSLYRSAFDISFYGFYGWDDIPFFSYTAVSGSCVAVKGTYERMAMFGVDAAVPWRDFVFRLEGAYFPERHMQTSADWQGKRQREGGQFSSSEEHHQLVGLVGFDWTPSGWTLAAQYIADGAFGDGDALERKSFQHLASLMLEKPLLNDTLTVSALAFFDLRELSSCIELAADYSLNDSIKLSLIGNLFLEGVDDKQGLYGANRDLSCITLKGTVSF